MMREMTWKTFRAAVICVILSVPAAAQAPSPPSDAQTISRGWAALAAGRLTEAASLANGILKRKPRSHAALSLKIEALSAGAQPIVALDAYEEWLPKTGRSIDDRGLLEPVAAGLLRILSADADVNTRAAALQFLANAGDSTAIDALRKRSAEGDQVATLALAARGDTTAISAVQALLGSGSGRDVSAAIASLAEHGGLTSGLLQTLATDRVPMNRAAAARALAHSTDPNAAQLLESLSQDPDPLVHSSVILARAQKGDQNALASARAMLASEVPDIRLTAAEALAPTLPAEVEQAVRPLLTNRDGLYRFRAAALVGRTDPSAVQAILIEGLADQNPVIQQESGRVVAEALSGEIGVLRQLLRHKDRSVVASAAGAIIGN
jgi:HEAT repeat protein